VSSQVVLAVIIISKQNIIKSWKHPKASSASRKYDADEHGIDQVELIVIETLRDKTPRDKTRSFNWIALYNDIFHQNISLGINADNIGIRDAVLKRLLDNQVVRHGEPGSGEIIFTHHV